MVFSSLTFLVVFLPLLLLVYFIIPIRYRNIRNYVLLVFSMLFYSWGEPLYVFLITITIALTYLVSGKLSAGNKMFFYTAIAINILPLVAFKYTDFIFENINFIFKTNIAKPGILLPIGISFYTFQMLTYVIDLYKGKVKRQNNIMYLALYVFLFPQMIAGPIVRYKTIENEIENRKENWSDFKIGGARFIVGLAKKVLISNSAGFIVKTIMEQGTSNVGAGLLWLTVFSYAIQIYFDFSGYSDMAIGLGKMLGFNFLENFNYPYIATSVTDFWRRWHISLSTFFRDYIYIPLGGNRVTKKRWILNMLIVWFLTGLWHGSFWNYIIWGIYYCILLILERVLIGKILKRLPNLLSWAYTFFMTLLGWTIFMNETNDPSKIFDFFLRMFSNIGYDYGVTIRTLELQPYIIYLVLGFFFSFPIAKKIINACVARSRVAYMTCNMGIIIMYLASIVYIVAGSFNPFIYFRF